MNPEISTNSSEPMYIQLANLIENSILSGEISYGEKIPSEGQLVKQHNLSRVTVRNAIQKLADEGIVEKKQGKGVYVAFPVFKEAFNAGGSFTSSGRAEQNNPTSMILSREMIQLTENEKLELGLPDTEVMEIKRIRKIDQQPVIFEVDYFAGDQISIGQSLTDEDSLIEKIKTSEYQINHFDNVIDLSLATKEMAEHLLVEENAPLLHIQQQVIDSSNHLIYVNVQYINSTVYKAAFRSY